MNGTAKAIGENGADAENPPIRGDRNGSSESREAVLFGRRPFSRAIHGMVLVYAIAPCQTIGGSTLDIASGCSFSFNRLFRC